MKTLLVTGVMMLSLAAAPAIAADVNVPPLKAPAAAAAPWTGFYIGVAGGYGWATSSHSIDNFFATPNFTQNGGLVGGTLGTNWQTGSLVLGFEGDLSWADIKGSATDPVLCPVACTTAIEWLATGRVRIGFAAGNVMPYLTGGVALAGLRASEAPFVPLFGTGEGRVWTPGGTAGGGVEVLLAPNLSAKAEYLFATFADKQAADIPNIRITERNLSIVRVGINYHFGPGGGAIVTKY
jgi:outer membrane immunogenic protein